MKQKPAKTSWLAYLVNDGKPLTFEVALEACTNVINKFKKQRDEAVSFLEWDIQRQNKNTREINFRLDLINAFNEYLQRKTAKMLFEIVDVKVTNSLTSDNAQSRLNLIKKEFESLEDIQKYRSERVDRYFNEILEDENTIMSNSSGADLLLNILTRMNLLEKAVQVFDPTGERHVEITL